MESKIEQDLEDLKRMLGKTPMTIEEILFNVNWSEEKTRIYVHNLLERKQIFLSDEGRYYRP
ncbi:MAG: hypothetical protein JW825_00730 [Candidatus Methanofastidiosa archaeon]|nr:hypothetical protein [Candidatus Methanofastidiosa archaeon]